MRWFVSRSALAVSLVFLLMLVGRGNALGQIAAWDFTGASSPATWTATTFNSNLVSTSGANNITRGSGASASAGSNSFRTLGFQNNGIATSNTDYFQVTLKAASGYTVSLSSVNASFAGTASFCASPGVTCQFAYSLDGSAFTLVGSSFALVGTPATMSAITLSGISALQNVSSSTTIYMRYYASGQTTTGGWGFFSSASGTNGLAIGGTVNTTGCTGTPTPGTATATPASLCSGNTTSLSLSGASSGTGITYQWQSSATGGAGSFSAISGATNTGYTSGTLSSTIFYRCVTTCTTSSSSANSNTDTINVNPLPAPTISGTTSIYSGASTNLTFTGVSGDTVYYWDGTSTNSTAIAGSGTATVTVSPTVTTTYSVTTSVSAAGCSQSITGQFATITVTTGGSSDTIPTRDDNMALGNPSGATTATTDSNNYKMVKSQYTLSYNNSKGMANWVSWHLSRAWKGSATRCDCFNQDGTLPSGYFRASTSDYTSTGFDRGHLCPSDDRDSSSTDNAATFLMTNISPQAPNMNQQTWGDLEEYCRGLIDRGNEMYIIAGGYGSGGSGSSGGTTTSIASGNIKVPAYFWKIVVVLPVGINDVSRITNTTRVIAVIMPNTQSVSTHSWDYYTTTIDSIEALTGYDFLSNVSTTIQNVIEAKPNSRLLAWDFTGSGSYTTFNATVVNSLLDTTSSNNVMSRGSGASASSGANSFRTTGFQNNGISTSNTDYFQVKVRSQSGYSVSLSSIEATYDGTTSFFNSPGVTSQYAYSLNGTTFTLIGSPVTSTSLTPLTVNLATITALQNVPSTTTIYLRYYASGQTTTGGWGFSSPYSNTYGLDIGGAVSISGCLGTPVAGTATPTTDTACNGNSDTIALTTTSTGIGIIYQWQSSATGGAGTYSNISGATDVNYIIPSATAVTYYKCITTCIASSLSNTSNATVVNIRSTVTPSVSIAASPSGTVCAGTSVTYTATPTNGGTTPGYQWKKGGVNISGATNSGYTYAPANTDQISCVLTSNAVCPSPATATSNTITATVTSLVTPTVALAASPSGAICAGTSVTFTATPTNGGSTPAYQWKLGTTSISGATNSTYTYTPSNGDTIKCVLTSAASCVTSATATSGNIIETVNPSPPSGGTITGSTSLFTGTATTLSNSTATSGTVAWTSSAASIATVNSTTGLVTGIAAGTAIITFTVTTSCGTNSDTALVTVTTAPSAIAAWDFTGANTVASWTATTFNGQLVSASGANNITRGSGASASVGSNSFRTQSFQNNGIATSNTDYFQVTLKAATGYVLSLSTIDAAFAGTSTFCASPGVATQFAYSLDGSTFTLIGSPVNVVGTPVTMSTINVSGISALQNVASGTTVYLRNYASGQTSTGGWGYFSSTSGSNGLSVGGYVNLAPCAGTPPHATATGTAAICRGNTAHLGLTGVSLAPGLSYQWQSSASDAAGTYSNISAATDTAYTTTALSSLQYYRCVTTCSYSSLADTSSVAAVTIASVLWLGGTSGHTTDWNTAANWTCGFVPTASDDVHIGSATYAPVITASASVRTLTIDSGIALTIDSSFTLNVKGDLQNNGRINGVGTVSLSGTALQHLSGRGICNYMELNNSAGALVNAGSKVTLYQVLRLTTGTLTTNDSLLLATDTTTVIKLPARIDPIATGASINGNVRISQYLPGGRRAFRFWSHPFSGYTSLSQLQQFIDVTGNGGAAQGFTTTGSNAPSAFRYDPTGGNSSIGYDPGWRPFASANGTTDSNRIHPYQGIRIYFRGRKGEGLGYLPYTPSATCIEQWGSVNQGAQTVTMIKGTGANQDYNMIGSPYPAPVDIGTVIFNAKTAGNITGSAFYVWNPYLGTAGQFTAVMIPTASASPYYLQMNTAFQVRAAHNGDTLHFEESNKGTTAAGTLLREEPSLVTFTVYNASYHPFDRLSMQFTDAATDGEDNNYDAVKPYCGADLNFFSVSAEGKKLAIDGRPLRPGGKIPLGVESNVVGDFIFSVSQLPLHVGSQLYLHDNLLNKMVLLADGITYPFTITADVKTQGEDRFELLMQHTSTPTKSAISLNVSPNPAQTDVTISFDLGSGNEGALLVTDATGSTVLIRPLRSGNGTIAFSIADLSAGVYYIVLSSGDNKVVRAIVKER